MIAILSIMAMSKLLEAEISCETWSKDWKMKQKREKKANLEIDPLESVMSSGQVRSKHPEHMNRERKAKLGEKNSMGRKSAQTSSPKFEIGDP